MAFQPGQSGNPRGRKPGIVSRHSKRLILQAQTGDTMAARLLLDRALPALKAVDTPAPIALGTDLGAAGKAVLAALAAGRATPDQAGAMASVLAALSRVAETASLEQRIANLEARNAEQP